MKDRLPTPEELWGPDYREHLQRQFDIYDAAVARERAEIAARNAASSPGNAIPSTDPRQVSDVQTRNSAANGDSLAGSSTSLNAIRNAPDLPFPDGVPSTDFPQASNMQVRNSDANGADLRGSPTALNAVRNEPDPLISLLESLPTSNDLAQPPRVDFTVTDALVPPPPLEWCVESLFACPSVSVLVGDPGSKKTLTIIDLAVCVAMGRPWLGENKESVHNSTGFSNVGAGLRPAHPLPPSGRGSPSEARRGEGFPVTQGAVLFIDEQTGPRQLLTRFNAALNAHGAAAETPIHIRSLAGHALRNKESADALIKLARSKNARLIVIDAFSNLLRGGSESSLAAVLPVIFHLRRLAEACNAAVVVTHHTNRHGSFRGSYAIAAAADLMLSIRSKPDESTIHVTALKSRLIAPLPFSARLNFEKSPAGLDQVSFTRTADSPSSPGTAAAFDPYSTIPTFPKRVTGEPFLICLDIYFNPNSSFKEIRSRNLSWKEGTLRNTIQQLIVEGVVERSNPGGQGTEARYSLARPP